MKVLVYADVQADIGSENLFNAPDKSLRLWCVDKLFADLKRIYAEYGCAAVIDLGDTFDNRSSIDHPSMAAVLDGLAWLPPSRKNVRLIGNHDQFLRDGSIHNGCLLDRHFHTVTTCETSGEDGCTIFYVSFPADYAALTEWLLKEGRRIRGPKMLFGHFQVQGAVYKGGMALTGVPKAALAPFQLVLLGHIHLPQALTSKIHYIGSPFQQDWGEAGQSKRVAVVDTEDLSVEWVPLTGYPEYRTIGLNEFKQLNPAEEHRYRVALNSHVEAEQFFSLPHFNRGVAQYNYDESATDQSRMEEDWSFDGICRRYMKTVPPGKVGIEMTEDELLAAVDFITKR